jgi:FkbM family methyltransferase
VDATAVRADRHAIRAPVVTATPAQDVNAREPDAIARATAHLPWAAQRKIWGARRSLSRRRRRWLERRHNWSRSRPALYGLDGLLERYLGAGHGFFVEAGACDGYFQSNTYSLERIHGWRGVLVEPVPFLARAAARDRSAHVFNCALVERDFPADQISLHYAGGMTVVAGSHRSPNAERAWRDTVSRSVLEEPPHDFVVQARTMTSILDEVRAPRIDFLSLDVEGYEAQVLDGLDLERFRPTYVLVEVADDPERRSDVERAIGNGYETVARLTPLDVLYRRRGVAADIRPSSPSAS